MLSQINSCQLSYTQNAVIFFFITNCCDSRPWLIIPQITEIQIQPCQRRHHETRASPITSMCLGFLIINWK